MTANIYDSADQRAKANAEMAKSSGQATKEAAPPAEKQHGQPGMQWNTAVTSVTDTGSIGDSKSTFQKLKEETKAQKPGTR